MLMKAARQRETDLDAAIEMLSNELDSMRREFMRHRESHCETSRWFSGELKLEKNIRTAHSDHVAKAKRRTCEQ